MAPRLALRPLEAGDAGELLRILRTTEVARWCDAPEPGFPLTDDPESVRLTILVAGRVAGLVQYWEDPQPKYRHAALDVYLDPAWHNRGLGSEAIRRVVDLLVDEHGHHRITIDPAAANAQAIKAYEKVGFRIVGTMREYERDTGGAGWHDGVLMELLAGERT